jgi:hypothetical protein
MITQALCVNASSFMFEDAFVQACVIVNSKLLCVFSKSCKDRMTILFFFNGKNGTWLVALILLLVLHLVHVRTLHGWILLESTTTERQLLCLLAFLLVVCKKEDSSSAALDVCSIKIRGQS